MPRAAVLPSSNKVQDRREGIAYFDYSEEDLQAEFASARELPPAETEQ
jgi:hypothetical protein